MMINILILLVLSVASAILYRLGGSTYGTKWRDYGVPTIVTIWLLLNIRPLNVLNIGMIILCFPLLMGSLTTYFKKKGTDAKWWNWLITGLIYGLAAFPLFWCGVHWYAILLRTIVLGLAVMGWSEKMDNPIWEECGRGALITLTLPLLLI
jgi:hypothetical protein